MDKLQELCKSIVDELEKKVRDPEVGSPAGAENHHNLEGVGKPMKNKIGDPRHIGVKPNITRHGANRGESTGGMTSGVSSLRPKQHSEYVKDVAPKRGGGTGAWKKSEEDDSEVCKYDKNGQWSLHKSLKPLGEHHAPHIKTAIENATGHDVEVTPQHNNGKFSGHAIHFPANIQRDQSHHIKHALKGLGIKHGSVMNNDTPGEAHEHKIDAE